MAGVRAKQDGQALDWTIHKENYLLSLAQRQQKFHAMIAELAKAA